MQIKPKFNPTLASAKRASSPLPPKRRTGAGEGAKRYYFNRNYLKISDLIVNNAQLCNNNIFTPVKNYLYNNAHIDSQKELFACAIYLRDAYLENHTGIK